MTNVWQNLSGTTSSGFTIGKNGRTIFSGNVFPETSFGKDGDLYISQGKVLQKVEGLWLSSSSSEKDFSRVQVEYGQTVLIPSSATYVGIVTLPVEGTSPSTVTTTVSLPNGVPDGASVIVKDEVGGAGTWQITVSCSDGSLIDGQGSMFVTNDYGTLSLTFCDGKWFVDGGF